MPFVHGVLGLGYIERWVELLEIGVIRRPLHGEGDSIYKSTIDGRSGCAIKIILLETS
jgi:hypothetical protein